MLFIAENLKSLRKKKDMTQDEVAEILCVSPQSVSKWERGDTFPDITLLPALANLYKVSVDILLGMDKINDRQTRNEVFRTAHEHWRNGDISSTIDIYSEALKIYPNDEGIMSDLAMALALDDDKDKLSQAVALCERVLSDNQGDKVHHTTRAALCFIYLKAGDKDKAVAIAQRLPHLRESREMILAHVEKDLTIDEIDSYLRFIAIGESDEQDIILIDFGTDMISVDFVNELRKRIVSLRDEYGSVYYPITRIRDNITLLPRQVRVRRYADYLMDKVFNPDDNVLEEVAEVLRKIAAG